MSVTINMIQSIFKYESGITTQKLQKSSHCLIQMEVTEVLPSLVLRVVPHRMASSKWSDFRFFLCFSCCTESNRTEVGWMRVTHPTGVYSTANKSTKWPTSCFNFFCTSLLCFVWRLCFKAPLNRCEWRTACRSSWIGYVREGGFPDTSCTRSTNIE